MYIFSLMDVSPSKYGEFRIKNDHISSEFSGFSLTTNKLTAIESPLDYHLNFYTDFFSTLNYPNSQVGKPALISAVSHTINLLILYIENSQIHKSITNIDNLNLISFCIVTPTQSSILQLFPPIIQNCHLWTQSLSTKNHMNFYLEYVTISVILIKENLVHFTSEKISNFKDKVKFSREHLALTKITSTELSIASLFILPAGNSFKVNLFSSFETRETNLALIPICKINFSSTMADENSQASPKSPSDIENDLLMSDSEENVAKTPTRGDRTSYENVLRSFAGFRRTNTSPTKSEASSTVSNKRLRNSSNDVSGGPIKTPRFNPQVEEVASNLNHIAINRETQSPFRIDNETIVEAPKLSQLRNNQGSGNRLKTNLLENAHLTITSVGGAHNRLNHTNARTTPYENQYRSAMRFNAFSGRNESHPMPFIQQPALRRALDGFGSVSMTNIRDQNNAFRGRPNRSSNDLRNRLTQYEFPPQLRRNESQPINSTRSSNLNVSSIVQRRNESSLANLTRGTTTNNNPIINVNAPRIQLARDITAQRFNFFIVPVEYPNDVVDAELERRFDEEVQRILENSQGNPLLNVEFLRGRLGAIPVICYGIRATNVLTTLIQRLSIRPSLTPLRAIAVNHFIPASICELRIPNQSENFTQAMEHLRATNPGADLYLDSWRLINASIGNRQNRQGTTFTFACDQALEIRIRNYDARRREYSFILLSYSRGCGHASIRLNSRYAANSGKNIKLFLKIITISYCLLLHSYQLIASLLIKAMIRTMATISMQTTLRPYGMLLMTRHILWPTLRKTMLKQQMLMMIVRKASKTWRNEWLFRMINKAYLSTWFEFKNSLVLHLFSFNRFLNPKKYEENSRHLQILSLFTKRSILILLKSKNLTTCIKHINAGYLLTYLYLTMINNMQLTFNGVNYLWGSVCKVRLKGKKNG